MVRKTPLSLQNYDPDIVPDIHKLRFWLNKKVRFVRVGLFAFIPNSFYTKNKEDTLLGVPSLFFEVTASYLERRIVTRFQSLLSG